MRWQWRKEPPLAPGTPTVASGIISGVFSQVPLLAKSVESNDHLWLRAQCQRQWFGWLFDDV